MAQLLLQQTGCAESKKPVRREQQGKAEEGAWHVSADVRLDRKVLRHQPEHQQNKPKKQAGQRQSTIRMPVLMRLHQHVRLIAFYPQDL